MTGTGEMTGSSIRALTVGLLVGLAAGACTAPWAGRGAEPGYKQSGIASWYGPGFHGKKTANGETYDMHALTAAHKELPFESIVEVVNRDNGRRVRVRINDRGPFVRGRIIDLSRAAAEAIDMVGPGTARVTLRVVSAGRGRTQSETRYKVQLGAFRQQANAEELLRRARRVDPDTRIRAEDGLYRVEVGPFPNRRGAENSRRAFQRRGLEAVLVPALP